MHMLKRGCAVLVAAMALIGCGRAGGEPELIRDGAGKLNEAAVRADLAPVLSRSGEGLSVSMAPTAGTRLDLQDRFQSAVLARRNPDGTIETECFDETEDAVAFVGGEGAAAVEVR